MDGPDRTVAVEKGRRTDRRRELLERGGTEENHGDGIDDSWEGRRGKRGGGRCWLLVGEGVACRRRRAHFCEHGPARINECLAPIGSDPTKVQS